MEYSIQQLARLSGLTARTLRWYDQIGLLKPAHVAESGYRYYGPAQVDRLQDILYYRALGVELGRIRERIASYKNLTLRGTTTRPHNAPNKQTQARRTLYGGPVVMQTVPVETGENAPLTPPSGRRRRAGSGRSPARCGHSRP